MDKREFYAECAALLGTDTQPWNSLNDVIFIYDRETGEKAMSNSCRWFGREPGNGRFPGFGVIRLYGSTVHIQLHHPTRISATVDSWNAALDLLRDKLK